MSVAGVTSTTNSNSLTSNTATAATTNSAADQKHMFMTLLVAQLKNQDPLQPQDGTAFVAQLAQFNSLDQLVGIRDSIGQLNTYMQGVSQAASTTA